MKKNAGAALPRTALLGCLAVASSALSAASSPASGQHGATAMGAQRKGVALDYGKR
jgi:hypothetical protein